MINEGCGLLGTGDGIAWNGGRRGTGFFFAETLKRETQEIIKKGGLSFLGLSSFFYDGGFSFRFLFAFLFGFLLLRKPFSILVVFCEILVGEEVGLAG